MRRSKWMSTFEQREKLDMMCLWHRVDHDEPT